MWDQAGDFEYRVLTDAELGIVARNLFAVAGLMSLCRKECAHCHFPLSALVEHSIIKGLGEVCDLCKTMHWAISMRPGLVKAQNDWTADNERSRRMKGN